MPVTFVAGIWHLEGTLPEMSESSRNSCKQEPKFLPLLYLSNGAHVNKVFSLDFCGFGREPDNNSVELARFDDEIHVVERLVLAGRFDSQAGVSEQLTQCGSCKCEIGDPRYRHGIDPKSEKTGGFDDPSVGEVPHLISPPAENLQAKSGNEPQADQRNSDEVINVLGHHDVKRDDRPEECGPSPRSVLDPAPRHDSRENQEEEAEAGAVVAWLQQNVGDDDQYSNGFDERLEEARHVSWCLVDGPLVGDQNIRVPRW